MCLDKLVDYTKMKSYKGGYGWKIFNYDKSTKTISGLYYGNYEAGGVLIPLKRRRWLNAFPERVSILTHYNNMSYYPGFHIYLKKPTKPKFSDYKVLKVKFKEPVCTGFQHFPCVVAKRMYVCA